MSNVTTWSAVTDDAAENYSIPTSPAAAPEVSTRVYDGPIRFNGTEQVGGGSTVRIGESDLTPAAPGMLASVRNNAGFPTGRITSDCTVELPGGMRTSVQVAESMGYLQRTHDGRYVETQPGTQEGTPQETPQEAQEAARELFPQAMEAEYSAMIADMPQALYDSAMGSAAAIIGAEDYSGDVVGKLAPRIASAMGMEPAQAAQVVERGRAMWQAQADTRLESLGVDPADFYQWAKASRKNELQAAVIQHITGRSTKGYEAMVDAYLSNTMPSPEALKAAGIPTKTEGRTTMVKLKGSWMSLASAVKAKLL